MSTIKATAHESQVLGAILADFNYTPDSALQYLKDNSYNYKGKHYSGSKVADFVAGAVYAKTGQLPTIVSRTTSAPVQQK